MNYPVLWNAIKIGLLVIFGLTGFVAVFTSFIAGLLFWGVPTGPSIIFALLVVVGCLVGIGHYMDNA